MKHLYKAILVLGAAAAMTFSINSCTDPVKFGNAFLEKAPGGTVTADTVFVNPEYTEQFLTGIYSYIYYALPTNSTNSPPQCRNYWKGMPDALSDCIQFFFANTIVNNKYYTGAMTSTYDGNGNGTIYPFINEYIWENIHNCYVFLENVDRCPLDEKNKWTAAKVARLKDECKCLIANTYFVAFRFYGGLPIVKASFSGADATYELPRASVKETVDFMVGLLDEVIAAKNMPFTYKGTTDESTETGRFDIASAMALKIKILQFAASPLFNNADPYWKGKYTMEQEDAAWLGSYDASLWNQLKTACEAFINANKAAGDPYKMVVPTDNSQEAYAFAYRSSYLLQNSPEIIMATRVHRNASGNDYGWVNLYNNPRFSYCPTQEYVEMFPWADGTPFNWEESAAIQEEDPNADRSLDHMFIKGERKEGSQMLQNRVYTRDPRLYENVAVNGQLQTVNWGNGQRSGANYETWVGGTDAQMKTSSQDDHYGTGYRYLKYYAGAAFKGKYPQWVWLCLSDVYLTYAEAILQTGGDYKEAAKYVDIVRARQGLGGIVECNPDKDLSKKENLLEEILRERACEFLFNDSRYFDLIRYRRADLFEKPLHQLLIYRLDENGNQLKTQWYNGDRNTAPKYSELWYEPSHFDYEKKVISNLSRVWWTPGGFDPKWYLSPLPTSEINKGYGLVQNPGW